MVQAVIFDLDDTVFAADNALHGGVQDLLAILRRLGLRIGALTSADHRMLVRLDEAGIREHFDRVLCTAHLAEPKAPEGVRQLLGMLGVEAPHAVFVSHAHRDIVLAKHAGVGRTIHVTHRRNTTSAPSVPADHHVDDIPSVLDVLE